MKINNNTSNILILCFFATTSFISCRAENNSTNKLDSTSIHLTSKNNSFDSLLVMNTLNWNNLLSFRLYDNNSFPKNKAIEDFTEEEIKHIKHIELDIQDVIKVFKNINPINSGNYAWHSERFAIAKFKDGSSIKLKISSYEILILDLTNLQHYKHNADRYDWDIFWNTNKMPKEKP